MRPENSAADSEFGAILRVGGLDASLVHRVQLDREIPSLDLNAYWGVIAGGSPFDISTPELEKSKVQNKIEAFYTGLFDKILAVDFPFLGCCSGNGLLGKHCGTPITRTYSEPIGRVTISLTAAGETDPLLSGLPLKFDALVGHKEACDVVPDGAVLLASSESCPVQMFRIKDNIYATQFHPEADAGEFIPRIKTYRDYGYFRPEEAAGLIEAVRNVQTPEPQKILRRFVQKYQKS